METVDIFRAAVLKKIDETPRISQADMARKIGERTTCLNDFLHGRRNYPDYKREKISRVLGTTYTELLNYGERLVNPHQKICFMDPDQKIINANGKKIKLAKILNKVRFILAKNCPERGFLIDMIEMYYKSLYSKKNGKVSIK